MAIWECVCVRARACVCARARVRVCFVVACVVTSQEVYLLQCFMYKTECGPPLGFSVWNLRLVSFESLSGSNRTHPTLPLTIFSSLPSTSSFDTLVILWHVYSFNLNYSWSYAHGSSVVSLKYAFSSSSFSWNSRSGCWYWQFIVDHMYTSRHIHNAMFVICWETCSHVSSPHLPLSIVMPSSPHLY